MPSASPVLTTATGTSSVLASYQIPSILSNHHQSMTDSSTAHIPRQMPPPVFSSEYRRESYPRQSPTGRPVTSAGLSSAANLAGNSAMDPPPTRRVSTGTFTSVFELPNPNSPRKATFPRAGLSFMSGLGIHSTAQASSAQGDEDNEIDMLEGDSGIDAPHIPRPGMPNKRKSSNAGMTSRERRTSLVGLPEDLSPRSTTAAVSLARGIKRESSTSPGPALSPATSSTRSTSPPNHKRPRLQPRVSHSGEDPLDSLATAASIVSHSTADAAHQEREAILAQTRIIKEQSEREIERRRRIALGDEPVVAPGLGGGLGAALNKLEKTERRVKSKGKSTTVAADLKASSSDNSENVTLPSRPTRTSMSLGKRRGLDAREKTKNLTIVTTAPSLSSIEAQAAKSAPGTVATPSVLLPPKSAPSSVTAVTMSQGAPGNSPYFPAASRSSLSGASRRASGSGLPQGRRVSGSHASGVPYTTPHQLPTPLQSSYCHSAPRYPPGSQGMVQSLSGGGGPPYYRSSPAMQPLSTPGRSPPSYSFPAVSPHTRVPPQTPTSYSLYNMRDQHHAASAPAHAPPVQPHHIQERGGNGISGNRAPSPPPGSSSKQAFMSMFSNFYDALSDSRVLSRTLDDQLRKSSALLAGLHDAASAKALFDSMIEQRLARYTHEQDRSHLAELQLLEERIVRLEGVLGGECEVPIVEVIEQRRARMRQRRHDRSSLGGEYPSNNHDDEDGDNDDHKGLEHDGDWSNDRALDQVGALETKKAVLARLERLEQQLLIAQTQAQAPARVEFQPPSQSQCPSQEQEPPQQPTPPTSSSSTLVDPPAPVSNAV